MMQETQQKAETEASKNIIMLKISFNCPFSIDVAAEL